MYMDVKYCVLKVKICDAIMTHKLKHYDAPSSVIYIISMLNNLSHRIHTETSLEAALFFVSACFFAREKTPRTTQFVLASVGVRVSIQKHWKKPFRQHKNTYFVRSTQTFTILDSNFEDQW